MTHPNVPTSADEAIHNDRMNMTDTQRQTAALEKIADQMPPLTNAINGLIRIIAKASDDIAGRK